MGVFSRFVSLPGLRDEFPVLGAVAYLNAGTDGPLPSRAVRPERLTEIRVPVPDRPGVLSEITTLAGDLGVNIADLEIAHSAEGDRGVLVLVVDAEATDRIRQALHERLLSDQIGEPDTGAHQHCECGPFDDGPAAQGAQRHPAERRESLGGGAGGQLGGANPGARDQRWHHQGDDGQHGAI